ncbi:Retrovirus-related Pol polyprotein from transposon opus [Vitis vinifera]|uniref:Retrovirus-related Pol polyprotein from transposon opus n=1 Tax=Vitis vinifera TaxID=29760 RepID=A0A438ICG8_VITVI|nr:Retrovirus-related Pol polyprotein from transposon opus [Vitis vinifera]
MCDACDFAIGVVLEQRQDGKPYVIYYANKTLNEAQRNYTTTEKELLAVVFALYKFRAYLVGSFIMVFTDHSTLKYLLTKQDAKARLIRWIFLLQEFNLWIKEKKGVKNVVVDHLSRLAITHNSHSLPINDDFPEVSLMLIEVAPWYAHIPNYLVTGEIPSEWKAQDKKHFFAKIHAYYWEEPFPFKYCADQMIRKCVPEQEQQGILSHCHESACGGHFASQKTTMKGIDFMGPFPMSFGYSYILVGVDYVSKWVEAILCKHNDHRVVLKFLKENIFSRFGVPNAIISDGSTHFCNKSFETLLAKYGVKHKARLRASSPQDSHQVETIPSFEGGVPSNPPQHRYATRRPPTSPPLEPSVRCIPPKRVRTSGLGETSRHSQPEPQALADSQHPSGIASKAIIKRPMVTVPPIDGNSDYRAEYHLERLMTPREFFYSRVAMDFYQSMTTQRAQSPIAIHFSIDGRQGILEARHIAEAFHIPY